MPDAMSDAKKRRLTLPKQNVKKLADDLATGMLFNEATADVWLKVQDERLPAHRAVLAARCDYFRAMLYGGMQEACSKEVQIDDSFSPALMRALVRYIYTQQLEPVTLEDAVRLVACADHFGMSDLRDAMLCEIEKSLSCNTVLEVLTWAMESHQEQIEERCLQYVVAEAWPVLTSSSFLELDAPIALRVLQAVDMQGKSLMCCRAAINWQAHWTKSIVEDVESQRAQETAGHLNPIGGQMRQYIDAATMRLLDQHADIKPHACSHIEAGPATIVRRSHGSDDPCLYVTVKPSTPRTRFTVLRLHGPGRGPTLWISPVDARPKFTVENSYYVLLRHDGKVGRQGRFEPFGVWCSGFSVDVVISALASGHREVSLQDGAGRVHTCTTKSDVMLWLGLTHPDDAVAVESLH